MDLIWFLLICALAAFAALIVLSLVLLAITSPYPIIERSDEEKTFIDPKTKKKVVFPSIEDTYEVNLSVVVPAYNEQERLPPMLDEALGYLEARQQLHPKFSYEVIIVSDGSNDKTVEIAQAYALEYGSDKVRCLNLIKNRGKGGAVRLGVQSARGATILFADADGASKFEDLAKLEAELKRITNLDPLTQAAEVADTNAIVIGSRAHLEQESLATRSFFRNFLMKGFHFLVWLLTVGGVRDTQCGFKLLARRAAAAAFASLHVERWAFDVELLYIAQKLKFPISEIPVRWTEVAGSKVTPGLAWLQMGRDLGFIWLRYSVGAWKIRAKLE